MYDTYYIREMKGRAQFGKMSTAHRSAKQQQPPVVVEICEFVPHGNDRDIHPRYRVLYLTTPAESFSSSRATQVLRAQSMKEKR